ncbi:MAG: aminotransferase class V-fold PLP-dependent enzyme [Saprospiraceae bacterium]|nr:aminotransferase class V-fold PLP-dependent enzyme [Saprospiraceae bacterium]
MLDLQKWRDDTPGTKHNIHLNNAGASLMPTPVIEAIKDQIDLESIMGGYEAAGFRQDLVDSFYSSAAALFGTQSRNIAFTSNATDAYNRALSSIDFNQGDVILTSSNDYVSNFVAFLSLQKRLGIKIKIVDNLPTGEIDLQALKSDIEKYKPVLFSLTHIPTNSGLIQPVKPAGEICRSYDMIYLVDGCQSAGQLNVDVSDIGCDFYSATFRKFLRGPRGAGFLYVSDRMLNQGRYPLYLDMRGADWVEEGDFHLHDHAKRFEDWENSYANLFGATAAIKYALEVGMPVIEKRCRFLAEKMRSQLSDIDGIRILDRGLEKGAIVTAHTTKVEKNQLKAALKKEKINCSFGSPLNALIDFKEKGIDWIVRFAPHYYNSEEEIATPVRIIKSLLEA